MWGGRAGENNWETMGTTVTEQKIAKKDIFIDVFLNDIVNDLLFHI